MKIDKTKRESVVSWLTFVFFAVVVPAMVTWQAFVFLEKVNSEASLRQYQIKTADLLERLRLSADTNRYICTVLNTLFVQAKNQQQLQQSLIEFRKDSGLPFEYLIWGANGDVFAADFDWKSIDGDWKYAWRTLYDLARRRREVANHEETVNVRKIFGPQFFPELHQQCSSGRRIRLISADSSLQKKLAWVKTKQKHSLVAFFDHSLIKGMPGLDLQVRLLSAGSEFRLGAIKDGRWIGGDQSELTEEELLAVSESCENPVKIRKWYVFKNALRSDLDGICYIAADKIDRLAVGKGTQSAALLFVLFSIIVIWRSYLVFCTGVHFNISIRKQLISLFVLSNTISLLIMALIGFDYIGQYRLYLQTESFSKGVTYLQSIDEMFVGEFSRQKRRMAKALARLQQRLAGSHPNKDMVGEFLQQQSGEPFRLFLIGSNTPYIGSELGIMKDGKFVEELHMDWARYKSMQTLVESMGKLGHYYLSLLNREHVSEIMMAQVELIAESLGQLRPLEMFQEFFAATGSFWQWGMGLHSFPAYIDVFRHKETGFADYVFLYLWKPEHLQRHYINQLLTDFNRNPLGLRIMAVDEDFYYANPLELLENEQIRAYSAKLRERTGTEVDFCNWEGERHLLMGLKCTTMDSIRLIGLYPISAIDRQVQQKTWLFVLLAIVSILVSLAVGLFVSRTILSPLTELQRGIRALQSRDFAFRLPDLGGDEFGNLAKVFNTTLGDLEELHVASTVKEKLSDSMSESVTAGALTWFGAESAQNHSGGDFLEIDRFSEQNVMILIGDVAGHGIGVSLITAFLKAALLQLKDLFVQPELLLNRIDSLLREAGSHARRRSMTMQCALLNTQTAEITIANAGHCFPVVVNRSNGSVRVIDMPSTPLGTGKKPDCRVACVKLLAAESLVLYTGGLYRNGESGFSHFIDVLANLRHDCPKAWCENVMADVCQQAGPGNCQDDMTMLVINLADTIEVSSKIV